MSSPRTDGFYMPAEWAPQQQIWMLWPERTDNWRLGGKPAQAAFQAVMRAIARFQPLTVGASHGQFENASEQLADCPNIRVVELSNNDAWVRDTGPTFVTNGRGEVRGVDWCFNAWGGLAGGLYFPWDKDDQVARKICQLTQVHRYRTDGVVLEGGSIHVDGEGTLLTTEECLLNHNRNPHMTRSSIEALLADYLGIEKVLWLPDGLYNDETDGHVDNFCCFTRPGEVLLCWTDDPEDPNYPRVRAALQVLETHTDAKGRTLKVTKMPIPGPLFATPEECRGIDRVAGSQARDPAIRLAGSYVNFLIINGAIIAPSFDDPKDAEARSILAECFPGRDIVMVPGREILLGGGNIHCITQQQPSP